MHSRHQLKKDKIYFGTPPIILDSCLKMTKNMYESISIFKLQQWESGLCTFWELFNGKERFTLKTFLQWVFFSRSKPPRKPQTIFSRQNDNRTENYFNVPKTPIFCYITPLNVFLAKVQSVCFVIIFLHRFDARATVHF